jgi:glycosyltransferase involved in cell wall biosynthesis
VWCVSRYVHDYLAANGVWSNLVTEHHFVNTERFRPDNVGRLEMRARLQADDRFVLLVVGQLIKEKGVDVAIRAMTELPDNVVLWIAGGGPEETALRNLIADLKLEGRAKLLGLCRDVQPYILAADCLVCPSVWGEAAGLVNLEAQACGTPVIASRIGGIPEYVLHERTGLLFTAGDPHDLGNCVRRFLDDPGWHADRAHEARVHALEQFSPHVRLTEWLEIYRRWREPS